MSDKPIRMTGKEYYDLLQKTRREALEEACKAVCKECKRGVGTFMRGKEYCHKGITWWVWCDANQIHKLLAAE